MSFAGSGRERGGGWTPRGGWLRPESLPLERQLLCPRGKFCLSGSRGILTGPDDPRAPDRTGQATRAPAHGRGGTGRVPQPSLFVPGKLCRGQAPSYTWSPRRLRGQTQQRRREAAMGRCGKGRARFSVQLQFSPHSSLIIEIRFPIIQFCTRQKEFFASYSPFSILYSGSQPS